LRQCLARIALGDVPHDCRSTTAGVRRSRGLGLAALGNNRGKWAVETTCVGRLRDRPHSLLCRYNPKMCGAVLSGTHFASIPRASPPGRDGRPRNTCCRRVARLAATRQPAGSKKRQFADNSAVGEDRSIARHPAEQALLLVGRRGARRGSSQPWPSTRVAI
jgi:hypothetical protein